MGTDSATDTDSGGSSRNNENATAANTESSDDSGGRPDTATENDSGGQPDTATFSLDEDGVYTTKDDVAAYIHEFGKLPQNFITKKEAKSLGWPGGSLEEYAPGKCIGGDRFGNYEGLLPEEKGRRYWECDIDTLRKSSRGPKRIIYSSDGLIFYTDDHYESFTQLY
ncbi:MAG: ribonuclease [Butyrivibrio sp.]|nr:ribonuclease [Butyrivibrio sp.]